MHKVHVIAVRTDSREDAIAEVECGLEDYHNQVYDWFEVGGRWSDYFGDDYVLDVNAHRERALEVIEKLVKEVEEDYKEAYSKWVCDRPTGFPDPDEFRKMDAHSRDRCGYYGSQLANIFEGRYTINSNFYDLAEWSACPKIWLSDTMLSGDLSGWYLVAVDMHF